MSRQPSVIFILTTPVIKMPNSKTQTIMITAADEISIDFRTSCSKDEAVAKLLDWMQGPVRRKYIHLTDAGISADQLPYLHTLDGSVADQLLELRQDAQLELSKAFEANAASDIMDQKESVVTQWDDKIKKAAKYFRDIDDELVKGKESVLTLDKRASKKAGTPQILLNSLDRWAQKKYKSLAFRADDDEPANCAAPVQVESKDDESSTKGGLGKVKADNLYTSFGFLVEAFAKSAPAYHDENGPNVLAISKRIEQLAKDAKGGVEILPGQGFEAIRKTIDQAMKTMKEKLKGPK